MSTFCKVRIEYKSDRYPDREAFIKVSRSATKDRAKLDRSLQEFMNSYFATYWVPKGRGLEEVMTCPEDIGAIFTVPGPFYEA